jgi:hypothetical protein
MSEQEKADAELDAITKAEVLKATVLMILGQARDLFDEFDAYEAERDGFDEMMQTVAAEWPV